MWLALCLLLFQLHSALGEPKGALCPSLPKSPLCETEKTRRMILCGRPPVVLHATHNGSANNTFQEGVVLKYVCELGYRIRGRAKTTCQSDGSWLNNHLQCRIVSCPVLNIINGKVLQNLNTYGSTVNFVCNDGYELEGDKTLTCMESGWDYQTPKCNIVSCPSVNKLKNGLVKFSSERRKYKYNTHLIFQCLPDYKLNGVNKVTCLGSKNWSAPFPTCEEILCEEPDPLWLGKIEGKSRGAYAVINFDCNANTTREGSEDAFCDKGKWNKPTPKCYASCFFSRENFVKSDVVMLHRETLSVDCISGYSLVGAKTLTCHNGSFDSKLPECSKDQSTTPNIVYRQHRLVVSVDSDRNFYHTYYEDCHLKCSAVNKSIFPFCIADNSEPGMLPKGKEKSILKKGKMWKYFSCEEPGFHLYCLPDSAELTCVNYINREIAKLPLNIKHGKIYLVESDKVLTATYSCDAKYNLVGSSKIYYKDGKWNSHLAPHCKIKSSWKDYYIGLIIGGGIFALLAIFGLVYLVKNTIRSKLQTVEYHKGSSEENSTLRTNV